jgi:hypothetical protein
MTEQTLDQVARAMATGRSRRAVLTALAGGLMATIVGHREVAAGRCERNEHHCRGVCKECCQDRHCSDRPLGQRSCVDNVCTCKGPGLTCTSSPQCCSGSLCCATATGTICVAGTACR